MPILHQIDPIAVSLGPVKVHWYGLMYLLAFGVAWWIGTRRVRAGRLPAVDENGFGDLFTGCEYRVQECHRILEDHADLTSAQIAHLAMVPQLWVPRA